MTAFKPEIEVLDPSRSSGPDHVGTVRIDVGEQRIHVMVYGAGHIKLKVNCTPMHIDEAYLRGGQNDFTLVGLRPA